MYWGSFALIIISFNYLSTSTVISEHSTTITLCKNLSTPRRSITAVICISGYQYQRPRQHKYSAAKIWIMPPAKPTTDSYVTLSIFCIFLLVALATDKEKFNLKKQFNLCNTQCIGAPCSLGSCSRFQSVSFLIGM